jgi:hypothetical protein
VKKPAFLIAGVLVALIGAFWTLQGSNTFHQSGGMNGKQAFVYIGLVVAIIGLGLIYVGVRTPRNTPDA